MTTTERPKPNRPCLNCKENIAEGYDAHAEDCPANPGHHHVLWSMDTTGLREEFRNDNS